MSMLSGDDGINFPTAVFFALAVIAIGAGTVILLSVLFS